MYLLFLRKQNFGKLYAFHQKRNILKYKINIFLYTNIQLNIYLTISICYQCFDKFLRKKYYKIYKKSFIHAFYTCCCKTAHTFDQKNAIHVFEIKGFETKKYNKKFQLIFFNIYPFCLLIYNKNIRICYKIIYQLLNNKEILLFLNNFILSTDFFYYLF